MKNFKWLIVLNAFLRMVDQFFKKTSTYSLDTEGAYSKPGQISYDILGLTEWIVLIVCLLSLLSELSLGCGNFYIYFSIIGN